MGCLQAKGEEPSLNELQAEINKHQKELKALEAAVPVSVNLGLTALQLGKVSLHVVPCTVCLGTMSGPDQFAALWKLAYSSEQSPM